MAPQPNPAHHTNVADAAAKIQSPSNPLATKRLTIECPGGRPNQAANPLQRREFLCGKSGKAWLRLSEQPNRVHRIRGERGSRLQQNAMNDAALKNGAGAEESPTSRLFGSHRDHDFVERTVTQEQRHSTPLIGRSTHGWTARSIA